MHQNIVVLIFLGTLFGYATFWNQNTSMESRVIVFAVLSFVFVCWMIDRSELFHKIRKEQRKYEIQQNALKHKAKNSEQ